MTPRRRRILAWCAFGLAMVLLVACSLTVWVQRQALDTDAWVESSTTLLQDDEVRQALATRIVDGLFDGDVAAEIESDLPPRLAPLAPAAAGLLREPAIAATDRLLDTPAAQRVWEEANRRAHQRLVALLEGDDTYAIQASDGDVILDLRPLIDRVAARVGVQPDLPADAGRITLMRSDQLAAAQDAVDMIRRLSVLALTAVAGLLALAIWLAEGWRRRMLTVIGVAVAAAGLLLLVARRVVGDQIVEALTDPPDRDVGWTVWLVGTDLLRDLAIGLIIYGVVLALGAWIVGPSRWATATRRLIAPVARREVAPYALGVVLVLLVLLVGPPSGRGLWALLLLAVLIGVGAEYLRRQIVEEVPSTA